MTEIILSQNQARSIDSLEISELVKKRHDSVKRTIEILSEKTDKREAVIARPHSVVVQKKANNRTYSVEVYVFSGEQGKLDSITVVAQLCPEFTAALVKRWYELESDAQNTVPQFQIPTTLSEALQLAADQAKKIEQDKPKVEYYEKIVVRDTLLNATQVAQKIGLSAVAMNKHLAALNVYNSGVKRARVFQQWFVDKGLGELKQTDLGFSQPMFTTKGEAWVIEKFVSEGIING